MYTTFTPLSIEKNKNMPPEKMETYQYKKEDFDPNGKKRFAHEMENGDFFFGSDDEYAEEKRKLREEAKQ